MASILQVNGKWRALVRRAGHKPKCKTWPTKAAAEKWARSVESEIDNGVAKDPAEGLTVSAVILAYRELREKGRPISDRSTEHYQMRIIDKGLGTKRVSKLTTADIVAFASMRKEDGAGPFTVNMDISKLGTIFRYGSAALAVPLPDVVAMARPTLTHLGLIGGGGKRERRPTPDELTEVVDYFREHHDACRADAILFAATSAVRLGELVSFKWSDVNEETRILSLWRKHPRKGKTLEKMPLLPGAWAILQRQPRTDGNVFPLVAGTLSSYFTFACRELGIPDLHFHDLRHEGASAMFESGMAIQEVALVTGHKNWNTLRRYTNLKPEDLVKKPPVKAAKKATVKRATVKRTRSTPARA